MQYDADFIVNRGLIENTLFMNTHILVHRRITDFDWNVMKLKIDFALNSD